MSKKREDPLDKMSNKRKSDGKEKDTMRRMSLADEVDDVSTETTN